MPPLRQRFLLLVLSAGTSSDHDCFVVSLPQLGRARWGPLVAGIEHGIQST